ncbi:MAG TPA: hypothetical protein VFJ64_10720 [Solirubrobacterales bacterium]|nr:hypothetical protein [Solirubrobacterales bacterium]
MSWADHISLDRVLLVVFVAGTLVERLRGVGRSLRSHGERLGALEDRVSKLEGKSAP